MQQENENTDGEGKIKERIEEEGCPEDVQMIAVADAAMHEVSSKLMSSIHFYVSYSHMHLSVLLFMIVNFQIFYQTGKGRRLLYKESSFR